MALLKKFRNWLFGEGYEIGERVYWTNLHDKRYSGEYVITQKKDKNGYIKMNNDKVGEVTVQYYEIVPITENK